MKTIPIRVLQVALGLLVFAGEVRVDAPHVVALGHSAHALVGAPRTPFSVAGVARRTTRRVVAAEAASQPPTQVVVVQPAAGAVLAVGTVVSTLPSGCTSLSSGGAEYKRCGESYYRAAFQGDTLVYVVVERP
ncbi:MAG: hypothetical protein WCK28_01230 [Burkholderiales bacterium]|jgi:hypothetical protein